jgi:hypothetical protein
MSELSFVVLADPTDEVALWAAAALRRHLGSSVALVSPADLAFARAFTYRSVGADEQSCVALDDGRVLESPRLRGVLNRLTGVYVEHWRRLGARDATYAEAEMHAAQLAWLHSLGSVVDNPPTPFWLGGTYRRPQQWRVTAQRLGIPAPGVRETAGSLVAAVGGAPEHGEAPARYDDQGLLDALPDMSELRRLVTYRGQVFGDCDEQTSAWARALAHAAALPLLGVDVAVGSRGAPTVVDVTAQPDLRVGGEALVSCLARAWSRRRRP